MKFMKLFIKGFIIGIGKIIPGVSGAMLAITLGVYEKAIKAISEFSKDVKKNFLFLLPLGMGAVVSIVLASKVVLYFLNTYYLPTILLFIGLIIGGMPMLFKKINIKKLTKRHYLIFLIAFGSVFLLTFIGKLDMFNSYNNPIIKFASFFLVGIIDSLATVVPGVSGTAIMMILGCYNLLLTALSSLTSISSIVSNLEILIPFVIGIVLGCIAFAKTMNYLLDKKEQYAYSAIIGFALCSIFSLLFNTIGGTYSALEIVIGIVLLIIGSFTSYKLEG